MSLSRGVRMAMGGLALALVAAAWAPAQALAFDCRNGQRFTLQSISSLRYVAPDFSWSGAYKGMLQAQRYSGLTNEMFRCTQYSDGHIRIRHIPTGYWVTADTTFSGTLKGVLRASPTTTPTLREQFFFVSHTVSSPTIQKVSIQSRALNLFVAAELGWANDMYGTLVARSRWYDGPWEKFWLNWS